jgi:exosortase
VNKKAMEKRPKEPVWLVLKTLTLIALTIILFWPTLLWLVRQWFNNDYYAHGPLIPLVSAFLIWRNWGKSKPDRHSSIAGGLLLAVGIGGNIWAASIRAAYLSAFCLIIILSGLTLLFRGKEAFYRASFPLLFLITAIPLPFVERISTPLQVLTADWSGKVASLIGLQVTQTGSQLALESCSFIVGAPCSGLRSLVTFISLLALLLYIVEAPWLSKISLAILALPIALLANVLRVTSLLIVAQAWGEDIALDYYHNFFGIVFYILALALLFALARTLKCHEIRSDI